MKTDQSFYILTEATRKSGLGHFMRCSALYDALEAIGLFPEFILFTDGVADSLTENKRHKNFNWIGGYKKLSDLITRNDVVIVDSYLANMEAYEYLVAHTAHCIIIDDNVRLPYRGGTVINGTIGAENFGYLTGASNYLLGAEYIPLRKAFQVVTGFNIKESIESMLVTFGGDDIHNLTPVVLEFLCRLYPAMKKNVVVGAGFNNLNEVNKAKDGHTNLVFGATDSQMLALMQESDCCISASGQTLYELAKAGVPTIGIIVADNQTNNYRQWEKNGFIKGAGWYNEENLLDNIQQCITALSDKNERQVVSAIGIQLVDGKGAIRIADYIKNLVYEN